MNTTTAARTVLATLALVAGSLTATAAPAAATTPQHTGHCHSLSSGYKSWVGFQTENLDCGHAHNIGRAWASGCGRSSSTVTAMHCTINETVGGHASAFDCGNKKATQSPSHYHVHCHDPNGRKVSFTFYPYGF